MPCTLLPPGPRGRRNWHGKWAMRIAASGLEQGFLMDRSASRLSR